MCYTCIIKITGQGQVREEIVPAGFLFSAYFFKKTFQKHHRK